MSSVLPILFNTDMVRAILDERKTVTRRVVKVPPYYPHFYKLHDNADGALTGTRDRLYAGFYKDEQIFYIDREKHIDAVYYRAPYQPGDILYVRETWCRWYLPHGEWIIAKWKSDHEKKEPEIETVNICRIIEIQPDGKKRCVHEEDIKPDPELPYGSEQLAVHEILKCYCMEHEGEYMAVHEVVSRVKKCE